MYLKLVNFNNFNFFNVKVDNNLCHKSWQNKNLIVAYFRLTSEVFIKKIFSQSPKWRTLFEVTSLFKRTM